VVVFAHPLAGGESLEESAVEAARSAIVDVLDGGGLSELGGGQAARETAVVTKGDFAIDEETEPIGVRHGLRTSPKLSGERG
jgi:hypothetical protein